MITLLDMRTLLFCGSLISFTAAGIMLYFSIARYAFAGYNYWTAGFVLCGVGALCVSLRGVIPDFISVVVGNMLVVGLPYFLCLGMSRFLSISTWPAVVNAGVLALTLVLFILLQYVTESLPGRVLLVSVCYIFFFLELLWMAVRKSPAVVGGQNWLLIVMILFMILSSVLRIMTTVSKWASLTFFIKGGVEQSISIVLVMLGVVGIMSSLLILTAHRLEYDLEAANRKLEALANQDDLSGLFNRRYFYNALAHEFGRARRSGGRLSLIMGDIDSFKKFNDAYGHQAGDDCIRAVGAAFRESGRRPSDVAARYGGEEFVMLLPDTDAKGAMEVARAIKERIRRCAIPHGESAASNFVTMSFGVACIEPGGVKDPDALVAFADEALYRSKERGRDRITVA